MLSDCKLPFKCAHGRPRMVPLVQLNSTKAASAKEEKPRLWKLKNNDPVPIFKKIRHPHPPTVSQFKMQTKTWFFDKIFTSSCVQNDFTESGQI